MLADRTNMMVNPQKQRQKSTGSNHSLVAKVTGIKNPSLRQGGSKILDELVGTGGMGIRKDSYLSKPLGN